MSQDEPAPAPSSLDADCGRAMQYQVAGRLDLAEPIYRSILQAQPAHGAANYGIGMLLVQLSRPADALSHLLAALDATPEIADYWLGYLEALLLLGDTARATDALALARRHGLAGTAVDEFARRLEARLARGGTPWEDVVPNTAVPQQAPPPAATTRRSASHSPASRIAAVQSASAPVKTSRSARRREALAIRREEAAVLALVKEQRFVEALPRARTMTERFPEHGAGWKIFGAMLWAAGNQEAALSAMRTSTRLLPRDAEVHCNLGTALNKLRRLDEAEEWLRLTLQIDPNFAKGHSQLADNLQLQGRYTEAEGSFRRAIAVYTGDPAADIDAPHSGLLFMMNHNPEVTPGELFDEHCRMGAYLERAALGPALRAQGPRQPAEDPERCLRVGFVSADLRNHAVASFIEPVLREWQGKDGLHVTVYYTHPTDDEISRRLQGYVARWSAVFGLSHRQLAERIAADGIDILIDLSGHTAMHRLAAFAYKPAPIQVSWLGYPATTGLAAMDYYLTDRHFLPPAEFAPYFTEKLVCLPAVWPFQPFESAPPVNPLPALQSGALTFGSFNRLGKINQATVQLWSALLRALPTARMMLVGIPLERQHHRLIEWFAAEGIVRERLTVHPWTTLEAHLALHHQVDLGLESTPYSGCTTSNHALWMGIPTLTLAGPMPASRLSAANLGHLGLDEFVAVSSAEFVDKGRYWADRLPALAALRAGLRARWQAAPARQPAFVAAGIERALRRMWREWCAGRAPESFDVA